MSVLHQFKLGDKTYILNTSPDLIGRIELEVTQNPGEVLLSFEPSGHVMVYFQGAMSCLGKIYVRGVRSRLGSNLYNRCYVYEPYGLNQNNITIMDESDRSLLRLQIAVAKEYLTTPMRPL